MIQTTLALALSLTVAVAVGSAQTSVRAVADIPFDFHVGNVLLPSGQYIVKSGFPTEGNLCIQSKDSSRKAIAPTLGVTQMRRNGPNKLVFNQYGSSYFLSQVWNPEDSIVRGLGKSTVEMEVARKIREGRATEVALKKY